MSIEEVEAVLENLNSRWTGEEPMTALLDDALTLRFHLKGGHPKLAEVDHFIERAERCISHGPG